MDKNKFIELSKICSNNSILVINQRGIFRLFTPFKAICVAEVESYVIGQHVTVISVKMSTDYRLVYIIQNKAFFHHYFIIVSIPEATQTSFN